MADELRRVLLVEDDPSVADIAKISLEDLAGLEVLHCSSGQEALDKLRDYAPDIVLMDVMMPGMDGRETLKRMLESGEDFQPPVVFMTARAQVHEQRAYLEAGAVGVIVKPFDPVSLGEALKEIWETFRSAKS